MSRSAPWHAQDVAAVERELDTSRAGLSDQEVRRRLTEYGPNQLEEAKPPGSLAILLHQFTSPLIYILLAAAVVTLIIGEYIDAGVIAVVLALNAVIGFTQERRAEASVRALMQLLSPRARVIRGGREREIESRDLVPGDLVLLDSGSRVPADLRLASATAFMVDESLLTGESLPVTKRTAVLEADVPLADRRNMVFMGSVVSSGRGRGYVVGTGGRTELGAIAEHIRTGEKAEPPLQRRMTRFAYIVAVVVGVSSAGAFVLGVALGHAPSDMLLVAVALAVATVPEGLPVAFTITLALGVRRMARRHAIIRRLPAVETLGSTTVIGSDKTGTLTENRMTVQEVWAAGRTFTVPRGTDDPDLKVRVQDPAAGGGTDALRLVLLAGVLTNEAQIYSRDGGVEVHGDPTEAALLVSAARLGVEPEPARQEHALEAELPFESERQYSAAFRARDGRHFVFVKGAPERVLNMCRDRMTSDGPGPLDRASVHEAAQAMAGRGLRVLAMAWRELPAPPADHEQIPTPGDLTFLGLQGMLDPPRAGVREAIRGCRDAGVRVIMITGDHAATARAIGEHLGIAPAGAPVLTGADLSAMDEDTLSGKARQARIYARVAPEQKLRVVRALQKHGEVVAVTGDGVNDAPALKAAQIGIAMGRSGTDVAREASDMVLTDDNFVSIYAAVEEGRVTFDNIRKVTFFLLSTGAAAIVTILAALVQGWPMPFLPAQLLWLNLVTNGLQDVALAFEPGEPHVLKRPPRRPDEGIISPVLWERTVVAGLVMAAGTLYLFSAELNDGSLQRAQTVALTTMVLFQMFHVGNSRSEVQSIFRKSPFSNPFLFAATAAALLVHVGALHFGPTQFVLRVEPIDLDTWRRIVLVAATVVAVVEVHKLVRR